MVVTVAKATPTATYVLVGGASLRIPMSYQEYLDLGCWLVDLEVPEVVVLENQDGTFAEVARFRERATTPGPFEVEIDPVALAGR